MSKDIMIMHETTGVFIKFNNQQVNRIIDEVPCCSQSEINELSNHMTIVCLENNLFGRKSNDVIDLIISELKKTLFKTKREK